jgi:hypothetical protein
MPVVATLESTSAPEREVLIELLGLHAQAMRRMPWVQAWIVVGLGLFIFVHVEHGLVLAWRSSAIPRPETTRDRRARK